MEFMSVREAADKWGISQKRVAALCSENRIKGATMVDNMWTIPSDAEKPEDASKTKKEEKSIAVKPFVKWAGGKSQLLNHIRKKYPLSLGEGIKKYAEPFVGGGAVLFDILSKYELEEVYISDINAELINTYKVIRDDVDELITMLRNFQAEYIPKDIDERKAYYYEKRNKFNDLKINGDKSTNIEKAALFIFLNKTCFNGLYRVNKKGLFNVPMGAYKKPCICDEDNLRNISKVLEKVNIICADYKESEYFIDSNTLVYFDPPYRPLNETSNFTSYTENDFDDKEQIELAKYIQKIDAIGAKIIISNSDPRNSNSDDDFFDELYKAYKIERVEATRMINSNSARRGNIRELLISNF